MPGDPLAFYLATHIPGRIPRSLVGTNPLGRSDYFWIADDSAAAHLAAGFLLTASVCRDTFPKNCMAESAYLTGLAIQNSEVLDSSRHSALVRVTHWIHAVSFFALVVSGIAILLAHTRF